MGDWGIKVSKPGFEVGTATPENLAFSSAFNSYKIFSQSSGSITVPKSSGTPPLPGENTLVVAHNLGYAPSFLVWSETINHNWYLASSFANLVEAGNNTYIADALSNSDNLLVRWLNIGTSSDQTVGYYYMIFVDRAE